jgi:CheY-like chemotaxis protein
MEMLQGKTIYLIEDNPANLAIISSILRRSNATVRYDRWGIDTIKRLNQFGTVDLIILDQMFPHGVSGYDIFDRIKETPAFANIPIVAVSAADPDHEMPKAKAKGFSGFISKPINHRMFPGQMLSMIQGEQVWADDDMSLYGYIKTSSQGD